MGFLKTFFSATQLRKELEDLENKKSRREVDLIVLARKVDDVETELNLKTKKLEKLKSELEYTKGQILGQEIKAFVYPDKKIASQKLEKELQNINDKINELIIYENIVLETTSYTVNGSVSKGAQLQKHFGESLVISFNNYFEKKAKAVSVANYEKTKQLIKSYFDRMDKRANIIGDSLNPKYLALKQCSLKTLLDIKIVAAEEKAKEREERLKLREQEKLLQEVEKAKAELAKERRMYEQSLARALTEAEKAEFEAKLKEIDKREADIDYRVNNARAGYLYITATDAMPNMTKLGVTRRLNPLVRIQELSSASVPFPFVCYGLVFSDNAFDLETKIHDYFDKQRVNKNNRHKEFFAISPQEAIDILRNKFNCEVHFVDEVGEESEE